MPYDRGPNHLGGKVVVITGAGRGIGAATAHLAASLGARVVVNDLDAAEAATVVTGIIAKGGTAIAHVADITNWIEAEALVDRAIVEWGHVDALFNNAGFFRMASVAEISEEHLRAHLEVNVMGSFACTMHAVKAMRRLGRGGAILNTTSGAQMGLAAMSAYGAAKGAVATATYAWAEELRAEGIRVNALSPMAATRMMDETQRYLGRALPAQISADVNAPIACYLLSDSASAVTGQVVRIEGRLLSLTSHPGIALPVLEGDWNFNSVAEAFQRDLASRQFPSGTIGMNIELSDNASRAWTT